MTRRKKAFGVSNKTFKGEQTVQSNSPKANRESKFQKSEIADRSDLQLPSYADLNSLEQFNFPPGYVDRSKI